MSQPRLAINCFQTNRRSFYIYLLFSFSFRVLNRKGKLHHSLWEEYFFFCEYFFFFIHSLSSYTQHTTVISGLAYPWTILCLISLICVTIQYNELCVSYNNIFLERKKIILEFHEKHRSRKKAHEPRKEMSFKSWAAIYFCQRCVYVHKASVANLEFLKGEQKR